MTTTETITATPTFSVTFGRTDAEFELQREQEWTPEGLPFTAEYLALPWDAFVRELHSSKGEADTYADAASLARLVVSTAPMGTIVRFFVSDGTGMSFVTTGWLPVDEALAILDRVADR